MSSPTPVVVLRDAVVLADGFPLLSGVTLDLDAGIAHGRHRSQRRGQDELAAPARGTRAACQWLGRRERGGSAHGGSSPTSSPRRVARSRGIVLRRSHRARESHLRREGPRATTGGDHAGTRARRTRRVASTPRPSGSAPVNVDDSGLAWLLAASSRDVAARRALRLARRRGPHVLRRF